MGKPTKTLLYLAVAFSALVTYFYDTFLNDGGFQPTEEQWNVARRLGLEERMLATTKEVWPECAAQGMSAIECKFFIDDEILRLFTDEDKFIPTRIIGKRANEDDWYNAVSIKMDDNDLALGRDSDGWIYYTFQWEGSGEEATTEQQSEIPPVLAEETPTGATEGATVETSYAPDVVAEYEALVLATTTTVATAGTTTTVTTTTGPTEVEVVEAEIEEVELDNVAVPFDFSQPPLVIEPEPILVEGAPTDSVIGGTDDNPINGGVIIDNSVPNSGEGDARLEFALNEPPTIAEEGARTIGPFDCRGLTGFNCCLLIKHQVRDADIYGKAIQCYLDYDETTCKKKWWLATEESKKVLIYANQFEKVSLDPVITGSWPQCEEKWEEDTRDWEDKTSDGRCGKDFGDALCPDGHCCSAHGHCGTGGAWCDFGCQSQCWANSETSGLTVRQQCGAAFGGTVCHGTYCCSAHGHCGSGSEYCEKEKGCQSQCWGGGVQEVPPQVPEKCKAQANVCIALDMSGSVCSPNFNNPTQCNGCPGECRSGGMDRDTCCPNFSRVKEFGVAVVNWINHLQFGLNSRALSLVTFASGAQVKIGIGGDIMSGLDDLDYSGGLTNHGSAIQQCQSTFDGNSDDATTNFILLVTDGVPTTKNGNYDAAEGDSHARTQASAAKAAGTNIETVFINPSDATASILGFMDDLSSSGAHYDVGDFEALEKVVNDIAYKIGCSGDGVVTPVAAPVEQASIPAELQETTYCGCSQCTESVMESKAGWHTCRARIEWMVGWRRKNEEKACRKVYEEFPEVCKCNPDCDN